MRPGHPTVGDGQVVLARRRRRSGLPTSGALEVEVGAHCGRRAGIRPTRATHLGRADIGDHPLPVLAVRDAVAASPRASDGTGTSAARPANDELPARAAERVVGEHLEESVDRGVETLDLVVGQSAPRMRSRSCCVRRVGALGRAHALPRQADDHAAAVRRVRRRARRARPRSRAGRGSASFRRSTAGRSRRARVGDIRYGDPDELQHAQHRVVDEQQAEPVEAAVLERVDEQADARQPREQPDGPGSDRVRRVAGGSPAPRTLTRASRRW